VKRKDENEKIKTKKGEREERREKGRGEREREECDLRFGMKIRSSLFSAAICAGYFDSLRSHSK